jgi:hypothetical protein
MPVKSKSDSDYFNPGSPGRRLRNLTPAAGCRGRPYTGQVTPDGASLFPPFKYTTTRAD